MTEKRVVITGLGCVSPNGVGREAFFQALVRGESGIRPISGFATDGLSCRIAGEIVDFDPLIWLSRKDQPHVPRTVPLGIAAATEALQNAGLDPESLTLEERRRFGVMIGSGGGGVEFLERQYRLFFEDQTQQASVYAIPSNTMGTLSSELHALWPERSQPCDFHGLHQLHGRHWLCGPAHPQRQTHAGAVRRNRCADHPRHHGRVLHDEDRFPRLEPFAF